MNKSKTKYMSVMKTLPNLRQVVDVESRFSREVRTLKYLVNLITGKIEIVKKSK
jgi:hypothetical protein